MDFIQQTTFGAKISAEILIASLVYMERLKKALPSGALGEYGTSHRIFLASLLIASKFLDDKPLTTAKLVEVIGSRWSTKEINRMERAFLNFLKFQLWVDLEELTAYVSRHNIDLTIVG
ncbi:hypothetical protein K493DRAFT_312573 [Basidiobolus meristosporus CBS 931.73]|uniref:Cyclin N-terminal domain-containing protein n=1 Tax=Basidiobolus meristosporus CBS 931.73 TaxID=1314790 RepID=A0A1Y1YTD4_9FUNG|nr:hypothetical protein K493DRAFT_312573 [Basidiobolus meristosporus CBS 931.73]|eukprot:ORY01084.1 hypothetical protein K493DRAFT_312573 [Basidiobolus meristosporus CBS 931.73]